MTEWKNNVGGDSNVEGRANSFLIHQLCVHFVHLDTRVLVLFWSDSIMILSFGKHGKPSKAIFASLHSEYMTSYIQVFLWKAP